MERTLEVFNSDKFGQLRTIKQNDGSIWFCLSDICKALDLVNPSQVKTRLSSKGVKLFDLDVNSKPLTSVEGMIINDLRMGNSLTNFIDEPNLYKCIFESRKERAESFKDWVCEEVLPSIRKYGMYAEEDVLNNIISNPEYGIRLLVALQNEREEKKKLALEKKQIEEEKVKALKVIERNEPKVRLADAVTSSQNTMLIGEMAKIFTQNGFNIGQNRLFALLREMEYLGKTGDHYNMPRQKYMERGYFQIEKAEIKNGTEVVSVPKITGKGLKYFINKFLGKNGLV